MKLFSNKIVLITILLVASAAVGLFLVFNYKQAPKSPAEETTTDGLGSELYESAQNPVGENTPDTNPFDANANPFKSSYKNPF